MTPERVRKRLSANIKRARKILALSQERLAEAAGISAQMMNDIEGCRRWPSERTLTRIADALRVDVHELFLPDTPVAGATPVQRRLVADELQRLFAGTVKSYLSAADATTNPHQG